MANRVFITGDTHGDFRRLSSARLESLDKDDYLIICGDFGGIWDTFLEDERCVGESRREQENLDFLEALPYTILFVDGNHENFDRLNAYKEEMWHGGKVHRIRQNVIHLMRGQVFSIGGKRIFAFGGAQSHDIKDGILEMSDPFFYEKRKSLDESGALYRINHLSWWKDELPSDNDLEEGLKNLSSHDNEVDYIVSHCCPGHLLKVIDERMEEDSILTRYFDSIREKCRYKRWYFGHYHDDRNLTDRETLLYRQIVELGESVNESLPVLGKPRYELFQPVKFNVIMGEGEAIELIGLITNCNSYGTFFCPDEPSYDITTLFNQEISLFKHFAESVIEALSKEEIKENSQLISYLATEWRK